MRAALLIFAVFVQALLAAPAWAEDATIPLGRDYRFGDGIVAHFSRLVIAEDYHGNTFSPDVENTTWYDLYFTYENTGSIAQTGHLEVSFYDDRGNKYPAGKNITDISMEMLQPGASSDQLRFVEAAVIPRDAKILGFQVFDGSATTRFGISGIPAATPTATTGAAATGYPACLPAALLPLAIAGIAGAHRRMR